MNAKLCTAGRPSERIECIRRVPESWTVGSCAQPQQRGPEGAEQVCPYDTHTYSTWVQDIQGKRPVPRELVTARDIHMIRPTSTSPNRQVDLKEHPSSTNAHQYLPRMPPPRLPVREDFPENIVLDIVPPSRGSPAVNILILLHGLGDTNKSFTLLGEPPSLLLSCPYHKLTFPQARISTSPRPPASPCKALTPSPPSSPARMTPPSTGPRTSSSTRSTAPSTWTPAPTTPPPRSSGPPSSTS